MSLNDYFVWEEMKKENLCWAGCNSLEDAIKGCQNLEELFCLWQTAQAHETGDPKSGFPKLSLAKCPGLTSSDEFTRSFLSSFCPDGFLKADGKAGVPVLFICRESNISDNIDNSTLKLKPEDKQIFWLREVIRCKGGDPASYYMNEKALTSGDKKDLFSMKRAQTKYYNCLLKLLGHLKEEKLIGEDVKLSDCAYLNINKRGGFDHCDQSRLAVYAERYQLFIQREIELIKPKTIVVCGELKNQCLQNTLEEIFRSCEKQKYWVYPKHPSRYTNEAFDHIAKENI